MLKPMLKPKPKPKLTPKLTIDKVRLKEGTQRLARAVKPDLHGSLSKPHDLSSLLGI